MNIEIDANDFNDNNFINICNILEKDIVLENLSINGGTLNYTHLTYDSQVLLVAKDDNKKLVGFASLVLFDGTVYVYQIAVKKALQGRGIGTALVSKTIDIAKEANMDVTANVRDYNINSQKMFTNLGFVKLSETSDGDGFYRFYQKQKNIVGK